MRTPVRHPTPAFRYCPLVAALACAFGPAAFAADYPVNDNLQSSLAAAIDSANEGCTGTGDSITFAGPFVVDLSTPLPYITCDNLYIWGAGATLRPTGAYYVYGGYCGLVGYPTVRASVYSLTFDGFANGGGGIALCGRLNPQGSTFRNNDTAIDASNGAIITGNLIHDNLTGIRARPYSEIYGNQVHDNSQYGIDADEYVTIGSSDSEERNFIYANDTGIYVSYGGTVVGNFIGTPDGTTPAGNGIGITTGSGYTGVGVYIEGNVISANTDTGIELEGEDASEVIGNWVGTDRYGEAAVGMGNGNLGIYVAYSYGGPYLHNNTVSGNGGAGILVDDAFGVTISANKIGTNTAGTAAIPNAVGMQLECSGDLDVSGNVVSGNTAEGMLLLGTSTSSFNDNFVGTNDGASGALPNGVHGVRLATGDCLSGPYAGMSAKGSTDAAKAARERKGVKAMKAKAARPPVSSAAAFATDSGGNLFVDNDIAYNIGDGVRIESGVQNTISYNRIYANTAKNINLDVSGGPLLNDSGDGDSGPNNRQNHPDIGTVTQAGGSTTVTFTLDSAPGTYNIEIFSNDTAPGKGEGRYYQINQSVTVGAVPVSGSHTFSGQVIDHFSLTATSSGGDTSEFSPIVSRIIAPAATITPVSGLAFGNVSNGSTSPPQVVTIRSTGTSAYQIDNLVSSATPSCYGGPICASGDFICSTNCSTSTPYAPGTSCQITASFAPSSLGPQTTRLYVCDNATAGPREIVFTGTGVTPPPVTISPPQFDFGPVLVGQRGPVQVFTVTNPGVTVTPLGSIQTVGEFVLVANDNCDVSLAPNASCTLQVAFQPSLRGEQSGYLSIAAASGPLPGDMLRMRAGGKAARVSSLGTATAALFGTGVQSGALELPASIDMGTFTLGSATPLTYPIVLRNSGNDSLTLDSITMTLPFVLTHDCPPSLSPGQACTVVLQFTTSVLGEQRGVLTVMTNATGASASIPVIARAQRVAAPSIRVSPTQVGFGDRLFGTTSEARRVQIVNEGGAPALLGPFSASPDFLVTGTTCTGTLAPQQTCFADVALRPLGFGLRSGRMTFSSNAPGSPHVIELQGTGCRPFSATGSRLGTHSNCAP